MSALARLEQNFEQSETGVRPGDDLVVDWGVGKVLAKGAHTVRVDYFNKTGGAALALSMATSGSDFAEVPAAALKHD